MPAAFRMLRAKDRPGLRKAVGGRVERYVIERFVPAIQAARRRKHQGRALGAVEYAAHVREDSKASGKTRPALKQDVGADGETAPGLRRYAESSHGWGPRLGF